MSLTAAIYHFVMPARSNNFRAKLLHNSSLVALAVFLVAAHFAVRALSSPGVAILGYAANIPPLKVVEITNQKRLDAGAGSLVYSETLSEAARLKGLDMLEKDYWAHVSPDGTEPWDFFRTVGYTYRFAGENLARDFSTPEAAIEAWLASPSHRDNMLSTKYTEIGVAVLEGDLNGADTTLIVQLFGTPSGAGPSVTVASADTSSVVPAATATPEPVAQAAREAREVESVSPVRIAQAQTPDAPEPLVSASGFDVMRAVTMVVVVATLAVFALDAVVVAKQGIVRAGGRVFAHLSFIAVVIIIILIARSGSII